jgi:Tol biopolymer transport system component
MSLLYLYAEEISTGKVQNINESHPVRSPNGLKTAFESNRDGKPSIYSLQDDELERLTHTSTGTSPAWSPDSQKIAFVSNRDGNEEIYIMNSTAASRPADRQQRLRYSALLVAGRQANCLYIQPVR